MCKKLGFVCSIWFGGYDGSKGVLEGVRCMMCFGFFGSMWENW